MGEAAVEQARSSTASSAQPKEEGPLPDDEGLVQREQEENRGKGNRSRLAHRLSVDRRAIFRLLIQLAYDNEEFFSKSTTWTSFGGRMVECCAELQRSIPKLEDLVQQLQEIAPRYDYDEKSPGNGYRSLVCVADTLLLHLVSLLKLCTEQRATIMFRLSHYCKEIEAFATVLRFLNDAFGQVLESSTQVPDGSLFPPLEGSYEKYHEILKGIEKLDSACFYGRPLGFQFSPSISRIFRFIGIILATYSMSWERGHGAIGSIINSGRFFLSPEQRASRIIKVIKEADINFCKGFWNLSELGNNMPKWFCPNMAVNELREVESKGPLSLATTTGGTVVIPEPSAHTTTRPVKMRVLSYLNRQGLSGDYAFNKQPPSPNLLFHCHGGGYVATSSKSHETYLRVWAKLLNCTVVSIDYSLAPENPFPRPTEECLYAYAWILNNPSRFGWTGEKLCMVGDSAGGNLIMSVNLRLIQLNVAKKPDALVPVYTPFLFQYLPSPSRLLSAMDPLLHMGIVLRCVAAYTGGYNGGMPIGGYNGGMPIGGYNGGMPIAPQPEQKPRKSLQEYVDQVQKTQRIDFVGGSQSIVSLVNLANGNDVRQVTKQHKLRVEKREDERKESKDEEEEKQGEETDSGEEMEDDNISVNSVQVDSDPLHIHLSTIFDSELVHFLKSHPTTKSNVQLCDENGDPVEEAEEATPSSTLSTPTAGEDSSTAESLSARSSSKLSTRLKSSVISVTSLSSQSTAPLSKRKSITASISNNNIVAPPPLTAHKRSLSQSLADTAVLAAGHAFDGLSEWLDRPVEKQKLERSTSTRSQNVKDQGETEQCTAENLSMLEQLANGHVPRDPLISPLYASDELLRQLPPCYLIGCHLDPLLDDTISFARRLRAAGGKVASLDLLPSVPHGFLNFTLMSPECRDGAKLCLRRIKQGMGMPLTGADK